MSIEARQKLASLLEATVVSRIAERGEAFTEMTADAAYREGLQDGVKLTVDLLEDNAYTTTVVHIDEKGNDDLVCVIGNQDKELARLSKLLWADVNS